MKQMKNIRFYTTDPKGRVWRIDERGSRLLRERPFKRLRDALGFIGAVIGGVVAMGLSMTMAFIYRKELKGK